MELYKKKGQVSLEYLILAAIGLSLILVALISLNSINKKFMKGYDILQFKNDADQLNSAINEVCILGKGNQRNVLIHEDINVIQMGDKVRYVYQNDIKNSVLKKSYCNLGITHLSKGKINIYYNDMLNRISAR